MTTKQIRFLHFWEFKMKKETWKMIGNLIIAGLIVALTIILYKAF